MRIQISRAEAVASFDIVVRVSRALGESVDSAGTAEALFEEGKKLPPFVTVEGDLLTIDIPEYKVCAIAREVGDFYEVIAAFVKSVLVMGKLFLGNFKYSGKALEASVKRIMED
jgi:hypothetical protein